MVVHDAHKRAYALPSPSDPCVCFPLRLRGSIFLIRISWRYEYPRWRRTFGRRAVTQGAVGFGRRVVTQGAVGFGRRVVTQGAVGFGRRVVTQGAAGFGRRCDAGSGGLDSLPGDDELDRGMRCWSQRMLLWRWDGDRRRIEPLREPPPKRLELEWQDDSPHQACP